MRLKDQVAIITGGSRGIGYATADKFLKESAIVILAASTQASADKAAAQLREKYGCSQAVLACAWVRAQSPCINLLVGARRLETLRDTLTVSQIHLLPDELAFLTNCARELDD